ncbi:MAG: HTTM domain-containing protein [Cyclobacteriaceae bacterium]
MPTTTAIGKSNSISKLRQWLEAPVSAAPLAVFRIIFGALMLGSTLRFVALGWVEEHFVAPLLHFKYFGLAWVEVLPPFWMYVLHGLMVICAVGIMLGAFYHIAAIGFFLSFTYVELIDITYYLNHYYFVSLVSFLLILVPANAYFSVDARRNPELRRSMVARWTIAIFQFQLTLVYLYAGLAKINHDWLIKALPLKIWLPANDKVWIIGDLFRYSATAYIFSWGGMLYDTFVPFFLMWRKTRLWAYLAVIVFHTITGVLFQIGVFPVVMIFSTLIFFSAEFHERLIGTMRKSLQKLGLTVKVVSSNALALSVFGQRKSLLYSFLIVYVSFQLLFPWRYLLYPGNLFWTEEGYRFSWRVMLMEKAGTATFYVKDRATGHEGVVVNSEFLNMHQEKQMAFQPDMLLQFGHFLHEHYEAEGLENPIVRVESYVTLNARPSQLIIDPQVNLAEIEDGWRHKEWILDWK